RDHRHDGEDGRGGVLAPEGARHAVRPPRGGAGRLTLADKPREPMARTALIAKEAQRRKLVEKYAERRKALKAAGDYEALQKLPRDASPVRLKNRCAL